VDVAEDEEVLKDLQGEVEDSLLSQLKGLTNSAKVEALSLCQFTGQLTTSR